MAYGSVKAGEQRIEEQMNELMDSPSMHKDQSWQDRARVTSGVLLVPNILLDEVEAAGVPLEHRQFHDDFKILSKKSEKCSKMFTMLTIAFIKAPTNWISPISDEFIISRMDLKNAREEIRPRLVELREKYCIVQPTL